MQEIVRGDYLDRVHIGLDFFDASINRVAAWAIGTRNAFKAVLAALLEPTEKLQQLERDGDFTARLALMEEQKTMPLGAVWDHYCQTAGVPVGAEWLEKVRAYEASVLSQRRDRVRSDLVAMHRSSRAFLRRHPDSAGECDLNKTGHIQ